MYYANTELIRKLKVFGNEIEISAFEKGAVGVMIVYDNKEDASRLTGDILRLELESTIVQNAAEID